MQKRVVAYIDGFNVYHSIANQLPGRYKWIDYRKLAGEFLEPGDVLTDVFLFTATPKWEIERLERHNCFMRAMVGKCDVTVVSGNYKSVLRKFNGKKMPVIEPKDASVIPEKFTYSTFEEKQTDVNIALAIFEGAVTDAYDKALIFSGDSDLAPGVHKSRKYQPDKAFHCVLPYKGNGRVMASSCDKTHRIRMKDLEPCIMEDTLLMKDGSSITSPYAKQ